MPYVEVADRQHLALNLPDGVTIGQINYILTTILDQWVGSDPNYERINSAIGVLECAKQEMYRRVAVPYEIGKCESNGDAYMDRS